MHLLTVAARFCGPPGTANGGYVAGLIAQHARETVAVRLVRPVPLGAPLQIAAADAGRLELRHDAELIAFATPAELELQVPRPPDYLGAVEASRHYAGFRRHAFPACFVCGPARARGDGLRIFAGPCAAGDGVSLVAAPWVPDMALGLADGKVRPEFMWAALDCPGYFAACASGITLLLGEFTAHVDRRVHVDEPCVIVGWVLGASGRKHEVGTALFDEDGELCARARAVWVEPRPGGAAPPRAAPFSAAS